MTNENTENNGRDSGGKFLPGNPGKAKGSTKNKLRDEIKSFIGDNWVHFGTWFEKLKEKEKIEVMIDLLPYAVPRLQSVAVTDADGNNLPKGPVIDYSSLSEPTLRELLAATTISENGNDENA